MKLAIMQPYFFPYLGYFALINNTDQWIILDEVQFIRHGWIERNRILKPDEGWQYIKVPLAKHSRNTLIKDIRIRNNEEWKNKILRQIEHYKKLAPYYAEILEFLKKCFEFESESIVKLNTYFLSETSKYLGINFNFQIYSEIDLKIDPVYKPDDWALNISKVMRASEYINLPNGRNIFDTELFNTENIKLSFLNSNEAVYKQGKRTFEPDLSIIDVLLNCGKERTKELLNQFVLI